MSERVVELADEAGTIRLGETLGAWAPGGSVFALVGELGAGKTRFVKGLARGLGIDPDDVVSPTFTMLAVHEGRRTLYHMDWYRMVTPVDLESVGFDECFAAGGVSAVEWADRFPDHVAEPAVWLRWTLGDGTRRRVALRAPRAWDADIERIINSFKEERNG